VVWTWCRTRKAILCQKELYLHFASDNSL